METKEGARYARLQAGDPAPWFMQRCTSSPQFNFDTVGGRYVLLCFFGTSRAELSRQRLGWMLKHRALFDDDRLAFFGVSVDAADEASGQLREMLPGVRHFWDTDRRICRSYGALPVEAPTSGDESFQPMWVLLNPNLQVRQVLPFDADGGQDLGALLPLLQALPPVERFGGVEMHAPVLLLPDIFEPAFCQTLIATYERHGGETSGFVRDQDGKTVTVHDKRHKVRRDHLIDDADLRAQIQARIQRRVLPAVRRAHSFEATRMERYLLACYDGEEGGHFRPHRDNTTFGTAHRRFALSVNLSDDFEGGELVFPEYGPRRYKPPVGAGVVFSCSLLHAVVPVRSGRRYAFLPFLYDEAAAAQREANLGLVAVDNTPPAG